MRLIDACADGQGVSKRGLMGFCDAAPGIDKALRVQYFFRNRPHIATYLDLVGALPEVPGFHQEGCDASMQLLVCPK